MLICVSIHITIAVLVRYSRAICDMRYKLQYDTGFSEKYRKKGRFLKNIFEIQQSGEF